MSHLIYTCTHCTRGFFKVETVEDHLLSSAACRENGATYDQKIKKLWNSRMSNSLAHSMVASNTQVGG